VIDDAKLATQVLVVARVTMRFPLAEGSA